jgi:hypothetical protein
VCVCVCVCVYNIYIRYITRPNRLTVEKVVKPALFSAQILKSMYMYIYVRALRCTNVL